MWLRSATFGLPLVLGAMRPGVPVQSGSLGEDLERARDEVRPWPHRIDRRPFRCRQAEDPRNCKVVDCEFVNYLAADL